jgi:hypothetical protein
MSAIKNLLLFLTMLIASYLILLVWFPITESIRFSVANIMTLFLNSSHMSSSVMEVLNRYLFYALYNVKVALETLQPKAIYETLDSFYAPDLFALHALSLFPSLFRLILAFIFVGSFLFRPLLMHPVSLVWRRIVESEKPVFTLIFGGAAAFATAISEAAKHL